MWDAQIQRLSDNTRRVLIWSGDTQLSYSQVVQRWQDNEMFRAFFIALLTDVPFAACFWETPPVTGATIGRPFEFVVIDSPQLAGVEAERSAFEPHFAAARPDEEIVAFANLGGDAFLVVPCPHAPLSAYPHILAFSRGAPQAQQHALWQAVGTAMSERVGAQPVWLSTAGTGVYWLHVRLDSRPKYYNYGPYLYAQECR